ncbi:MAG: 50S ribosomal protein L22 [Acidobacteria bacterium]|nr:50S ribosomal protein L22 [Acidobacteriota bacterium]
MEAKATLKYLKASAQKVRLIADQVRGRRVEEAYQILRFTKKMAAKDLEKLLRSAVANAESSDSTANVDDLVVSRIYVNEGPTEKRIQPASMGRAFRILKRQSHVTIHVSDEVDPVNKRSGGKARSGAKAPAKAGAKAPTKARATAAKKTSTRAEK